MLSATVIALNEEKDLPRCLKSLQFCDEVIVVDSGSTDKTVEIAKKFGAKVIQEPWHGYGAQKNFAMQHAKNEWVLNLDADEAVTPELKEEILKEINSSNSAAGYFIARKTFYLGKWVRFGGWYPNHVTRLCRKSCSKWTEPKVHEELKIEGEVRILKNPMLHFTFSDISDQLRTNLKYAKQGAEELYSKQKKANVFKLIFKPISKFFETYFFKLGMLDGLAGFIISVNAAHSVFMKYSFLFEMQNKELQQND